MSFEVSKNMKVLSEKDKKVSYIVLKIGNSVFSTKFEDIEGKDIILSKEQLTDTKNIGIQKNKWIKGFLTEGTGHMKLPEKIPFELNIYEVESE